MNHAFIAFIGVLCTFNLPASMIVMKRRWFHEQEDTLSTEVWINCTFILECLFYVRYERGVSLSHLQWTIIFAILMNELTLLGGDWFGHHVLTVICFFAVLKILAHTVYHKNEQLIQYVWSLVLLLELVMLVSLPLLDIWKYGQVKWYVLTFLLTIPQMFPTSNLQRKPVESLEHGILAIHQPSLLLADRSKSSPTNLMDWEYPFPACGQTNNSGECLLFFDESKQVDDGDDHKTVDEELSPEKFQASRTLLLPEGASLDDDVLNPVCSFSEHL